MPKRILIIEDEKDIVQLLSTRLREAQYEILFAYDGEEGLRLAQTLTPDLIIMDIKIPKMDGWSVAKALKKEDPTRKIPIIVLSGYRQMQDLFKQEGILDYFIKPFDVEDLVRKIEMRI